VARVHLVMAALMFLFCLCLGTVTGVLLQGALTWEAGRPDPVRMEEPRSPSTPPGAAAPRPAADRSVRAAGEPRPRSRWSVTP